MYLANRFSGFVIALNSRLLPEQSLKNMVYCDEYDTCEPIMQTQLCFLNQLSFGTYLFTRHAGKTQMRLNDKVHARFLDSFSQGVEFVHRQGQSSMRNWDFVAVNRIVIVDTAIVLADPVTNLL
jgi:hypothetical protein